MYKTKIWSIITIIAVFGGYSITIRAQQSDVVLFAEGSKIFKEITAKCKTKGKRYIYINMFT